MEWKRFSKVCLCRNLRWLRIKLGWSHTLCNWRCIYCSISISLSAESLTWTQRGTFTLIAKKCWRTYCLYQVQKFFENVLENYEILLIRHKKIHSILISYLQHLLDKRQLFLRTNPCTWIEYVVSNNLTANYSDAAWKAFMIHCHE